MASAYVGSALRTAPHSVPPLQLAGVEGERGWGEGNWGKLGGNGAESPLNWLENWLPGGLDLALQQGATEG